MTNQQGAPEALRPIARYKIGYHTDEWGMRSSSPSGIPDPAGAWVRYEDHVAALVEAQQPAPSASAALPEGWVPLVITHEGQYPEEVAYGPQILMDRLGKWLRKYFDHVVASKAQPSPTPQADSAQDEPLQAFDSPRAKALMRAWEEGWAACRDAEYVGEEAQNDAFNSSHTLTLCIAEDQQLPAPQADSQPAPVRDYPSLPAPHFGRSRLYGAAYYSDAYTPEQMRAYVDADRAARAPAGSVTAPAGGWHPFPHYLQNPDGRLLRTSADLLERHGYTGCSTPLRRMADALLNEPAAPTPPAQAADSVLEDAAPQAMLAPQVSVSENTLRWWRELATANPQDLVPRIDAYLDAARKQGGA